MQPELIKPAERAQVSAGEAHDRDSVRHVQVFRMGSVRTSILGRPRHLSRHRRASRLYTLNCEEPPIIQTHKRPGRAHSRDRHHSRKHHHVHLTQPHHDAPGHLAAVVGPQQDDLQVRPSAGLHRSPSQSLSSPITSGGRSRNVLTAHARQASTGRGLDGRLPRARHLPRDGEAENATRPAAKTNQQRERDPAAHPIGDPGPRSCAEVAGGL